MNPEKDLTNKRYLGDGVYAGDDGDQLWLYTLPSPRHPAGNQIALELWTLGALRRYVKESGILLGLGEEDQDGETL